MSRLAEYLAFAKTHPALFVNPPDGCFTILLAEDEIRKAEVEARHKMKVRGFLAEWAEVGIAYQDQYVRIFRDAVCLPDGSLDICTRFVGEEDGAPGVFVLPVYRGHVLLIRHFRHETRTWRLEIPGGFGQEGVSGEESARREMAEEIGATISRLFPLGQVHQDLCSSSDCFAIFYAEVESYGEVEVDEGISGLLQISVPEFERMIRENEITDTFVIVAYTRAKLKGLL